MGVGYLPVFVSYFGISLMIVAFLIMVSDLVSRFNSKLFRSVTIILALTFSLIIMLNYVNNSTVVETENHAWLYPRALMESGLHNGIFKQVPSGSYLLAQNSYPWDRPEFYSMYGGVKLGGICLSGYDLNLDKIPVNKISSANGTYGFDLLPNENFYYLNYKSDSLHDGYAVAGRVIKFNATNISLIDVASKELYVYIEGPFYENRKTKDPRFQINGQWSNVKNTAIFCPFQIKEGDRRLRLVSSGSGWALYLLRQEDYLINLKSVSIEQIRAIKK
jgi:hypothetical protein